MSATPLVTRLSEPPAGTAEACYQTPLPVEDAAKLAALAELYPQHTPESLITELLHHALDILETPLDS